MFISSLLSVLVINSFRIMTNISKRLKIFIQYIKYISSMISILQDANNGLDREFTYLNEISHLSFNQTEGNCQSTTDLEFEETIPQEHYIADFCQDPTYKGQSQQEEKNIEAINPQDQVYQPKQQKIALPNFKTLIQKSSPSQTQYIIKKETFHLDQKRMYKMKQIKKTKKEQYPTKNFLPCFRSSFINFLASKFSPKYFDNIEVIKRVRGKKCISMADYQDIFNQAKFQETLEKYFHKKIIYHHLMTSRIEFNLKKLYFQKLNVFQDAFRQGVFQRIN